MTEFQEALVSEEKNPIIPSEYDYFANFIGSWEMKWTQEMETNHPKTFDGEWIFSRVMNGLGVQDLFIVPKRSLRTKGQADNAEYGTTIRVFNPQDKCWEVFYTCLGEYTRLRAVKEGDRIVVTEKETGNMKWIFSDITKDTFHWQNKILSNDGKWIVSCDCLATRRS